MASTHLLPRHLTNWLGLAVSSEIACFGRDLIQESLSSWSYARAIT